MTRSAKLFLAIIVMFGLTTQLARAAGNESVASAIEAFITSGQINLGKDRTDERLFQMFTYYQDRNFKPIWTRDSGAKTKGRKLLEALKAADEHGLNPANYSLEDIEDRIDSKNPEVLAELDLLLSDIFADYSRDLSKGRIKPSSINRDLAIQPHGPGPLFLIDGAEQAEDLLPYLKTVQPQTPRYDRLKVKLADYRKIAAAGGWPLVPTGKTLKPGDSDPRVPVLARMLEIVGDLPGSYVPAGTLYDDELVAAVKRFQLRHGRNDDGVIGPSTLKAIQVPIDKRIQQIVLNLERRRWMKDDLGKRYVFVNQADQVLKVVDEKNGKEKTVHTARVVVGKPYHRTPVFSNTMKYIVINPYWNVPSSIANNEYLPKLRRNPGALARENIRLLTTGGQQVNPLSIDWSTVRRIPYRLRQDTGARNALGRIKFMFPNKFNVYIHDTPSKSLFARESRYFSHGCMRVQNPEQLASTLLAGQGWSPNKIASQIASGKRRIVNLKKHIPVHVTYLTSWANKDGSVHFRDDIYGRDKILAKALGL
ncbi:MAG: L,D-transpeptidase family protein [Rhizobiales bacterium]|nr:L,D-transpeptidase family protein [Hyphomicrobiales bacterium]